MDNSLLYIAQEGWHQIVLPILRLSLFVALGLFVANMIENLNWTNRVAALSRPLIRFGNLSAVTGASFSMAFFSGVSANTMLSEAYDQGKLCKKELFLANLFNSLPRFFLHLPTVFFLTAPLIKSAAFFYVGITFTAALMQTFLVVFGSRIFLPGTHSSVDQAAETTAAQPSTQTSQFAAPKHHHARHGKSDRTTPNTWRQALDKSLKRLKKRMGKILKYLIPVYVLFFLLHRYGLFDGIEEFLATKIWFLSWLNPKSLGIVVMHVTTEFSAGLAAASALLAGNSLTTKEVVLALVVGNILSTPIRAIRHQLPYYTGIYRPRLAIELVLTSQILRATCVILVALIYYFFC